jgi:hypothetical protein
MHKRLSGSIIEVSRLHKRQDIVQAATPERSRGLDMRQKSVFDTTIMVVSVSL